MTQQNNNSEQETRENWKLAKLNQNTGKQQNGKKQQNLKLKTKIRVFEQTKQNISGGKYFMSAQQRWGLP